LDRPEIGIHGSAEMLCEFSYASGMTVIHVDDIDTMGTTPSVSARAR
jgi:agmatinase